MGGMHNVEKCRVAITVASSLGIEKEKIKAAVENFPAGWKEGLSISSKTTGWHFIDDYASIELRALIRG